MHQQVACDEYRQHEVVHVQVVFEIDQAEQLTSRNAVHTVFTARKTGLNEEEKHQLRQRQSYHRKVDALSSNRQECKPEAQYRGCQRACNNAEFSWQAREVTEQVTGCITAGCEECRMTERKQPRKTKQEVERHRKQGEAQDLHQENRIDHERSCKQNEQ